MISGAIYDRGITSGTLVSSTNHAFMLLHSGRWPREVLKEIECPAVVMSAGLDQTFAAAHGVALARELRRGELVRYEGVGHELPRRIWERLSGDVRRGVARGEAWRGEGTRG